MLTCFNCGTDNPAGARFCTSCGSLLSDPPVERREVRKTVTVVFSDLVGSTALGERLDPESLREVILRYYERAVAVLTRHGGTVGKFIGDAVMAIYGVPQLHEDDALRAVRAAAELGDAIAGLNDELEACWGVRLALRSGVNTGEVVVGDAVHGQHVAVGDAVNVASRLEQSADPGEVWLGEPTWRLVRDAVTVERVGALSLKGKAQPVPAYRLIAVAPRAPGHARRLGTPMVGRAAERRRLSEAFERVADERACRLITVLGPAGIGKSRLVDEFLVAARGRATVLRGRCLDYGEGITFWALAEIVRGAVGAGDGDTPEELHDRLVALLRGEDQGVLVASRVAGLIGAGGTAGPAEEAPWAVRRVVEALSRHRPLVIVLDDLHWAEPALLDLIESLTDGIRNAPLLLCCTARPELLEVRPGWGGGKPYATAIVLEALPDPACAELIDNLLGDIEGAAAVRAAITRAADGNPLFVEELVAVLIEDGLLVRSNGRWVAPRDLAMVPIPATISALLGARLDQLDQEERAVLERASVIGKVFHPAAVSELSPEPVRGRVGTHLAGLTRRELIRPDPQRFAGEDAFRFRHLLVRDAAYAALPKRQRAALHERFAGWLERTAGERAAEYEEIVGYHLEQAYRNKAELGPVSGRDREVAERAGARLASAGRKALARDDRPAGAKLLLRAADLLSTSHPVRLALLPDLGEVLTDAGELKRAEEVLAEAVELTRAAGDHRLTARAVVAQLYLRMWIAPELPVRVARSRADWAIGVFTQTGDALGLAKTWRLLALILRDQGRIAEAEQAWRRLQEHARVAGDRRLQGWGLVGLAADAFWGTTPPAEGIQECHRILEELAGSPRRTAFVLDCLAGFHAMLAELPQAERLLAQAASIREDLGGAFWRAVGSADVSGYLYLLAGRPVDAEKTLRRSLEALERAGDKGFLSTVAALLAQAVSTGGDRDPEAERLTRISEAAAASEDLLSQILWRSVRAKLQARRGAGEQAGQLAREAVSLAEPTDFLNPRADALLDLAEVLRLLGQDAQAASAAHGALALYRRKGNVVSARRVSRLLQDGAHGPSL
jgi:class 3 adenylate cyclase/tetratricopeptide (TPR) repeat protein